MDAVLRGRPFCFTYTNDVLIASLDADTHRKRLEQVFTYLLDYHIQITVDKSEFDVTYTDFLVRTFLSAITPASSRYDVIQHFPKRTI